MPSSPQLQALTENRLLLAILAGRTSPQHRTKIIILDLLLALLILLNETPPLLLAGLALHLVLVDGGFHVEVGELAVEVRQDVVVELR